MVKDSKAMNQSYGRVNLAATNELKNMVNALVQSQNMEVKHSNPSSNSFKPNRFQKKKRNISTNYGPGRNGARFNNKRNSNGKKANPALKTPPKKGESEIKFIENKKRYWCAKCGRWTLSHGTNSHMTKEELHKSRKHTNKANAAKVNLDWHPAAF